MRLPFSPSHFSKITIVLYRCVRVVVDRKTDTKTQKLKYCNPLHRHTEVLKFMKKCVISLVTKSSFTKIMEFSVTCARSANSIFARSGHICWQKRIPSCVMYTVHTST